MNKEHVGQNMNVVVVTTEPAVNVLAWNRNFFVTFHNCSKISQTSKYQNLLPCSRPSPKTPTPLESYKVLPQPLRHRTSSMLETGSRFYVFLINSGSRKIPLGKHRESQNPETNDTRPGQSVIKNLWGTCCHRIDETFVAVMQDSQTCFRYGCCNYASKDLLTN